MVDPGWLKRRILRMFCPLVETISTGTPVGATALRAAISAADKELAPAPVGTGVWGTWARSEAPSKKQTKAVEYVVFIELLNVTLTNKYLAKITTGKSEILDFSLQSGNKWSGPTGF
jgi:hypothetical protein